MVYGLFVLLEAPYGSTYSGSGEARNQINDLWLQGKAFIQYTTAASYF